MTIPGYKLTVEVFEEAEKRHSDLMESWSGKLALCDGDAAERQAIMRAGLAATFRQRYPMPEHLWRNDNLAAVPV